MPAETHAEKSAREAREASARSGSAAGATSVAEAVKRVADAAVAEIAKVPTGPLPELSVSGAAGGRFVIKGEALGTNGVVTFGGVQVKTDGWGGTRIEGVLPADVKSGEVVVHIDDKTQRRGSFLR